MSPEDTPCPGCGVNALRIEMRLISKPIGSFSLAGVAMKTVAQGWPYLVCDNCKIEAAAKA